MRAVIVRGVKYKVDQTGHTLQRVQTPKEKGIETSNNCNNVWKSSLQPLLQYTILSFISITW